MWILALETTTTHGSVALLRDDAVAGERELAPRAGSVELFPALQALLAEAGIGLRAVELFAVADGPGSFTGVRIGLSAVKGFAEVLGTPATPVSTLRAVAAAGVCGETAVAAELDAKLARPVAAALDAQRGEAYLGVYLQGAAAPPADELLLPVEQLARRMAAVAAPLFVPQAALRAHCVGLWARHGIGAGAPEAAPQRLAAAVGRLGRRQWLAGQTADALALDARYIRRPDAELLFSPRPRATP